MAEGEFAQVEYHLDTGIEKMAYERGSVAADLDMHTMALDAAARSRDQERVNRYLSVAEDAAERAEHELYSAVTLRARGVAHMLDGDWDAAADQLIAAAARFRTLETPWQVGRTLLDLGEVEQNRGNPGEAKRHYSEALDSFESLGAAPYAQRAQAGMDLLG